MTTTFLGVICSPNLIHYCILVLPLLIVDGWFDQTQQTVEFKRLEWNITYKGFWILWK